MSSSSIAPVDTVEPTRAQEGAETRITRGAAAMKRRVLDIEDVVQWAFRDELPKRREEGEGAVRRVSPMFRLCDFGMPIDNWSREPGFPAALGFEPHPDALKVEAAVAALARFHDAPIDAVLDLGPDFAAAPGDEAEAMRRAFLAIDVLVVRAARLRHRPFWQTRPTLSPVKQPNGKPVVLRWETRMAKTLAGGEVAEEFLVPVAPSGTHYPPGAYCALRYDQEPRTVLEERAEYLAWWAGLNALAEDLAGQLESIAVLPPAAAQKPWLGEPDQGKPMRVFQDLSARVYRQDQATAAAHRSLGQRRVSPARRGLPATPIARRPAQVMALNMMRARRS